MSSVSTLPDPMSPPDGVVNYKMKRYSHFDQRAVDFLEHRLLEKILLKTGIDRGSILNVPCGYGRFSEILQNHCTRLVYYDLHPKMVSICSEEWGGSGRDFINGSIRNLPFKDGSFDIVICIRLFHHFFPSHDRFNIISELARVSRRFVLLTYYRKNALHSLMRSINKKGHRIIMMSREGFYTELNSAGLRPLIERSIVPVVHAQRFVLSIKS